MRELGLGLAVLGWLAVGAGPAHADERWKPSADLRLRSELESFDDAADRWRLRLRARAGGTYRVSDTTAVAASVGTGSASPTSSQLTFGDGFGRAELRLAEAYLELTPVTWATVRAGKVPNDFRNRRLVWDRDVRPEGVTEVLAFGTDQRRLIAAAGQYVLAEREAERELYLVVGQVAGELRAGDLEAAAAVSFYGHPHARGDEVPFARDTNSVNPDGTLADRYRIAAALADATWSLPHVDAGAYVEAALNLGADDDDRAIALGLELAADDAPVELGYEYRRVERDAILDSLAESSWHDRRTGFHGHKLRLVYELSRAWRVSTSLKLMRALDPPRTGQIEWLVDVRWKLRS